MSKPASPKPSYSQDIAQRNIWQSETKPEEKEKTRLATPYSSSLENLDPSTQEFMVDAGIKLPTTTGHMTSAASMPNLTSIGKVKDQIVRSNSIPDNSAIEGELAKYLISNEEMEHYEAEYHKGGRETPSPSPPPAPTSPLLRPRGRAETRLRPPSFTSALTGIKTPPPAPVPPPPEPLQPMPSSHNEPEETKPELMERKSTLTKSRSSPPKDEMTKSQKWNDGSVERLAEKWAAKRDTLLRETGSLTENLQQRKVAMEQRLESVKRSIPKRSLGFTPQSAQKRLSLCESFVKQNKFDPAPKEELPKRKSLDIDLVIPPDADDSDPEDSPLTKKLNEIRRGSPQRKSESPRKLSPELGSSDSDDSLPPYPADDRPRLDLDHPLPPPPPVCEPPPLEQVPPPPERVTKTPQVTIKQSPKLEKIAISAPSSTAPSSSKPSLLSSALSSRSSLVTYKTVSAPLTSVAVSRTLPAPQRSIADSPRLPFKTPEKNISSTKLNLQKLTVPEKDAPNELDKPDDPVGKLSGSVALRRPGRPAGCGSRLQGPPGHRLPGPHSSADLAAPTNPDTNSSNLSAPSTSKTPQKRLSKIATTQVPAAGPTDSSFSTFKGKTRSGDKPKANGTKTIIYIEGPQKAPRLSPSSNSLQKGAGPARVGPQGHQKLPQPPHTTTIASSTIRRAPSPQRVASPQPWRAPSPQRVQSPTLRRAKSPLSALSPPSRRASSPQKVVVPRAGSPHEAAAPQHTHYQPGRAASVENMLNEPPPTFTTRASPPRNLDFGPTTTPSLRSPVQTSPSSAKPRLGLQGPRRSSGVRMWAGSRRLPGAERRSPTTSRSPSPATRATASNVPGRLAEPGSSLTLPRTTGLSRLRAPASPQVSGPQQRRSYGGAPSYQGAGHTKFPSAPNTPRHSQADLTDSRPSSPVPARRKVAEPSRPRAIQNPPSSSKPTPPPSKLGGARPGPGGLQLARVGSGATPRRAPPPAGHRPTALTAPLTTFSAPRAALTTSLNVKSRLPNTHKGFGYNQNS